MPRVKLTSRFCFPHTLVLGQVEKELKRYGINAPPELPTLVLLTCYPTKIDDPRCAQETKCLIKSLQEDTDRTVQIMQMARRHLARWKRKPGNKQSIIVDFLLSHNALAHTGRDRTKGKFILIRDTKIDRHFEVKEQVFRLNVLSDGEIATYLSEATNLDISADNVKDAREHVREAKGTIFGKAPL
jgi:hypothetical protein